MNTPTVKTDRRTRARAILCACKIEIGADFHALTLDQLDILMTHARMDRYRQPANANGSLGRYYHAMLQRRAEVTR